MQTAGKDHSIIEHILNYCDELEQTVLRFGSSAEQFSADKIYRNAATMCFHKKGKTPHKLFS